MTATSRRTALLVMAGWLIAPAVGAAAPVRYRLDQAASRVGFVFTLNGLAQAGTMPVLKADIVVDPRNLAASRVDVTVDVTGARTGLLFATQALTGPEVLDAARYPTIRFVSTRIQLAKDGRLSGGARITGNLTMHGATRPVTLEAALYRAPGSRPDDLSKLSVQLKGNVSRSAFGAAGYANLVADAVALDIVAVIRSTNG